MTTVWVLGNGQLGAMLAQAGAPLGLTVKPVAIDSSELPELAPADKVTAEREQWPATQATSALASHANFANLNTFATLADRKTQKSLLDQLGLATAPWQFVSTTSSAEQLHQQLGERVLLKRCTGGYDGRGQHWLKGNEAIPEGWHEAAIAEQAINFTEECSLVGVRGHSGECHFYPLTLNLNTDGILRATLAPAAHLAPLQARAETMLASILNELDYVGVMGMELFRVGNELLINELAPRVHNTGHWTQAGASISQFEYHLRAVADLPLAAATIKAPTVMINIIGTEFDQQWLGVPGCEVHWYQKEVRPGRKVGHLNLCSADSRQLAEALESLKLLLPDDYSDPVEWLLERLTET